MWKVQRAVKKNLTRLRGSAQDLRTLMLELFKHPHGVLTNIMFYALEDDKLFGRSRVHQLFLTAPALPLVLETFEEEITHPLQIERPARSPPEVVELDNEGNVVRGEASPGVQLCLKEGPSPVCEGVQPPTPDAI